MTARLEKLKLVLPLLTALVLGGWVQNAEAVPTFSVPTVSPGTITKTSGAGSTVKIPVRLGALAGSFPTGVDVFRVTIKLSAGLTFAPDTVRAITMGGFTSSFFDGVTVNGPLLQTIARDPATGLPTEVAYNWTLSPAITGTVPVSDTVMMVAVGTSLTANSTTQTVTLDTVPFSGKGLLLRDPGNNDLNATCVTCVVGVPINLCTPLTTTPTGLIASGVKSGNGALVPAPPAGIAGIRLGWTTPDNPPPGTRLDIWRTFFGYLASGVWTNPYPEYDDGTFFDAREPATPTGNSPILSSVLGNWAKLAAHPLASDLQYTDTDFAATARGFWYYVVSYASDPVCMPIPPLSNRTGGTLNYLLGDIHDGATADKGDDAVGNNDISHMGSHYGINLEAPGNAQYKYIDFGPTMDRTPDGRPHPDDAIGFEDMMIIAPNYSKGPTPQFSALPAAADRDELTLDAPTLVRPGESFAVTLRLSGAGDLTGLSTQLGWNPGVAEPVSYVVGGWAAAQGAIVLSAGPGGVDAALVGRDRPGFLGDGILATVGFRALAGGDPGIGVVNVDARNGANRKVDLLSHAPPASLATSFAPPSPNPSKGSSIFSFSLARPGTIELLIFSVDGRRMKTLAGGVRGAGLHRAAWDGTDDAGRPVQPGLFFARLVTEEGRFTRPVVRLK